MINVIDYALIGCRCRFILLSEVIEYIEKETVKIGEKELTISMLPGLSPPRCVEGEVALDRVFLRLLPVHEREELAMLCAQLVGAKTKDVSISYQSTQNEAVIRFGNRGGK